tara:strand:+ start:718 stop:1647 length:930 start_codon:yes stop_codon:yes gene_type:complete
MPAKQNALLNLIRSKKSDALTYGVTIALTPRHKTKSGLTTPYQFFQEVEDLHAFVIGHSESAILGHTMPSLLARHLAILTYPIGDKIFIRALALHPSLVLENVSEEGASPELQQPIGGLQSSGSLHLQGESFELEVEVRFLDSFESRPPSPEDIVLFEPGKQLAFHEETDVSFIGTLVDSVTGPGSGGHAIPALSQEEIVSVAGAKKLTLRSSKGYRSVVMEKEMLERGILIGRSRRCQLGRQYSDQDGLSRLHAMVIQIENKIYALDLASKYGLRDVTKPTTQIHCARLDNQIGCLVYGAGHLVVEKG